MFLWTPLSALSEQPWPHSATETPPLSQHTHTGTNMYTHTHKHTQTHTHTHTHTHKFIGTDVHVSTHSQTGTHNDIKLQFLLSTAVNEFKREMFHSSTNSNFMATLNADGYFLFLVGKKKKNSNHD